MATLTRISFMGSDFVTMPRVLAWLAVAAVPAVSFALLTVAIQDGHTPSPSSTVWAWGGVCPS